MGILNWITHEPADEYHARSRNGEFMSSHLLADFRESPLLYRKETTGQIEKKDSPAFAIGRATHSLILEGIDAFERDFLVADGPINPRTGEPYGKTTKSYADWMAEQDREIVSSSDFEQMQKYCMSVRSHKEAAWLLSKGEAEGVVRARLHGVPCQIRMDWFSSEFGLVDLKTAAELKYFESDCKRYGYLYQLGFYRAVIREVIGENVPVHIIAVEKCEPFATGVWELADEALTVAENSNKFALNRYLECLETGVWPTGYEEMRFINEF